MTWFNLSGFHLTYKGGGTQVAIPLETDRIIGAYLQAIETTHTTGIINITAHHLNTLRLANLFTFHAIDTFVRINLDVIEGEIIEAS